MFWREQELRPSKPTTITLLPMRSMRGMRGLPARLRVLLQLLAVRQAPHQAAAAGPDCRCCPCNTKFRAVEHTHSQTRTQADAHATAHPCAKHHTSCVQMPSNTETPPQTHLSSVQKHSCSLSCVLPLLSRQLSPSSASSCTPRSALYAAAASAHNAAAASCRLTSSGRFADRRLRTDTAAAAGTTCGRSARGVSLATPAQSSTQQDVVVKARL